MICVTVYTLVYVSTTKMAKNNTQKSKVLISEYDCLGRVMLEIEVLF